MMGSSSWSVVICVISARFFTNPQAYKTNTNKMSTWMKGIFYWYNNMVTENILKQENRCHIEAYHARRYMTNIFLSLPHFWQL